VVRNIFFIILQSLGHSREKKGNWFRIFTKGLIKCTIKFLQKSNLLKPLPIQHMLVPLIINFDSC
jgi:hypothetical protein